MLLGIIDSFTFFKFTYLSMDELRVCVWGDYHIRGKLSHVQRSTVGGMGRCDRLINLTRKPLGVTLYPHPKVTKNNHRSIRQLIRGRK